MIKNQKYHLAIILTNQCNLKCSYCYENNKQRKTIPINLAKEAIAKHLNDESYEEVVIDFFGGEPFLEFAAIKELCEWTWSQQWKAKYIFFATTNGVLLHNEIKEWLRSHKKRIWVSLSLDGKRQSHNINRSNSFDLIDINFFKECWPEQTVKMTISKETAPYIYENITYIHSLGFKITGTNFAEGLDWSDTSLKSIVVEQLEKLCNYYIEHPDLEPVPLVNMRIYKCEEQNVPHKWCGCGEHMVAIDTDGEEYPCTFFTPMSFSKKQLQEVKSINFFDTNLFIDKECYNTCYLDPICNSCYGANLLTNGCINKRDKSKCELMKIRAVMSAYLAANRLRLHHEDTYENALTAKAIIKINSLYNI